MRQVVEGLRDELSNGPNTGMMPQRSDAAISDFLKQALDLYYLDPWHALWRSLEAGLLASRGFEAPVLDIGCGDGLFASLLFAAGMGDFDDYKFYRSGLPAASTQFLNRVEVGIDLSPRAVQQARKIGVYKTLAVANACKLPFSDEAFATVFSNCVIEHIPNLRGVLSEISRVLKPGGQALLTVPSERFGDSAAFSVLLRRVGLRDLATSYSKRVNRSLRHFHTPSPREWRQHLVDAGLQLADCRYYLPRPVEIQWSIAWALLNFGWGSLTLGALVRQLVYGLDLAHVRVHKRILTALWLRLLRQHDLEHDSTPDGEGGGLFLVIHKRDLREHRVTSVNRSP